LKNIYFFGGGKLLASIVDTLNTKKNKKILRQHVFTSVRHSKEKISKNLNFKQFLLKKNIKFNVLTKIDLKLKDKIKKGSIGISFGATWIFKKDFIKIFNNNFYNIHGSDLPEDRGGGGFSWQILSKKKNLTSSIHYLKPGIDKGEIIFKNKIFISGNLIPSDRQKIYDHKTKIFFMSKISKLFNKKFKIKKQSEKNSSYWPRLNSKIHGWIDWSWSPTDIFYFSNAFDDPYEGAKTKLNKNTIYLKKCFITKSKVNFHPFQTGIIIKKNKDYISVSCKNFILNFREIFNQNRKKINLKKISLGDRLNTPSSILEKALSTRVRYK
jgi:methionyl-tRNA formyltransferase